MELDISVSGLVQEVQPREATEAGNQVPPEGEVLVKIEFLLKDILKVPEEDGEVKMSQTCCEHKTISMYSSQVDDLDELKLWAFKTLRDNLLMDPVAADTANPNVATTIMDLVQTTKDTDPSFGTVLLEIKVECSIELACRETKEPIREHGYAKLLQRLDDGACGICLDEFSLPADIFITPCHHTYHRRCLQQWLNRGQYSCPNCRSTVLPWFSKPIEVE